MTTVGYGDVYPMTTFGRLVAVLTMFSGIIIVALPITVIGEQHTRTHMHPLSDVRSPCPASLPLLACLACHKLLRSGDAKGANFEKQYEKQFFQDAVVDACTTVDGFVNYPKLQEILTDLYIRGNLLIGLPEGEDALRKLVERYDVQQRGRLDAEDWAALIMDCVCEAHEFTDLTVQKMVVDVHSLKEEVGSLASAIADYRQESDHQFQQLHALINGGSPPPPRIPAPQLPAPSYDANSAFGA